MDWLQQTPEQREQIHKYYNVDETEIKTFIGIIKEWKNKQAHLPEIVTDNFIAQLLLKNKFRIETTKRKLEDYYTIRGRNPEFLSGLETIVPSEEPIMCLPIPKLTPTFERILIVKFSNSDPDVYDLVRSIKHHVAIGELLLKYDYSITVRAVLDCTGASLKHISKWNPAIFTKIVTLVEKGYSCRVKGVEVLNSPPFTNQVMKLLKMFVSSKQYAKVRIHPDLGSLYEVVPKDCLPEELGGTCSNFASLKEALDEVVAKHKDFFIENNKNISLEHLRSPELSQSDVFGSEGTFRNLTID